MTDLKEIYDNPELFWTLSENEQEHILFQLDETFHKLLEASEQSMEHMKSLVITTAGFAEMMHNILKHG